MMPTQEFVTAQGAAGYALTAAIDGANLEDTFGKIQTDSCNLSHGTSPSNKGFRLTSKTNLGTSMPSPGSGKSLRIPIERTTNSGSSLRAFASTQPPLFAAHLKRHHSPQAPLFLPNEGISNV
jgi:hypothetical protein